MSDLHNRWPHAPPRDPHFDPTYTDAPQGHFQATAQQAAERGWFFRSEWFKRMVPDTRRCFVCGETVFDELPLSENDQLLGYSDQLRGMASGPLAG